MASDSQTAANPDDELPEDRTDNVIENEQGAPQAQDVDSIDTSDSHEVLDEPSRDAVGQDETPLLTPGIGEEPGRSGAKLIETATVPGPVEAEGFFLPKVFKGTLTPGQQSLKDVLSPSKDPQTTSRDLHRFSLYETQTRFYLVGGDITDRRFRMLKIDRTSRPGSLSIVEDEVIYTKREMDKLLIMINDGNRAAGGMKFRSVIYGVLGFIRFTEVYYMLIITKRQPVAMLGGHYIYQVDGTELIPITVPKYQTKSTEEGRFLTIFNNLDLNRSFYFSYSYNVTRTLQHNIIRDRHQLDPQSSVELDEHDLNNMFVWNHHLLAPAVKHLRNPYDWCLPITHGFVDQSSVNVFGRNIYVTLIARRSRFFAGARFLKRGVNDLGYVANDVETEQIVADMLVTSFNAPGHRTLKNPNYTSYVQHRGSIPLHWTQDNSGVTPKPAIDLNIVDPFYASAGLHFDNLFERYGAPVTVLNLVKARERTPRESKLLVEYKNAINYLNQSLPEDKRIIYRAYDMSRAAKTGQDVIGSLENIAEGLVASTGIFHNGSHYSTSSVQNGVTRSNCIDCLDRTNAAQFVIAKKAFAVQLQALGVIVGDQINYDSDASNLFAHMFNDHGDILATQYGGSHLVNTTDSYRKINNWQSHSRDMLESFKRYYHNSFLDNQRQEAYNLFLGNYIYAQGQPMLWELPNDYYLHHVDPSKRLMNRRRHYIRWFTPEFLLERELPPVKNKTDSSLPNVLSGDWWYEYYRPLTISSFLRLFTYQLNSTARYLPKSHSHMSRGDLSPFAVRKPAHDHDTVTKEPTVLGKVTPLSATSPPHNPATRIVSLQKWLNPRPEDKARAETTGSKDLHSPPSPQVKIKMGNNQPAVKPGKFVPADKNLRHQWTLEQFHSNSLHPTVSTEEASEYERYVSYPLEMKLVVSSEEQTALDSSGLTFMQYIERGKGTGPDGGGGGWGLEPSNKELANYENWVQPRENPLLAQEGDLSLKRYRMYAKWKEGKSFFKQNKVDPEAQPED